MLDHITLSVSNIETSKLFYDSALAPIGMKRLFEGDGYCGYGNNRPEFWIAQEERPATRTHVAFQADSQELVNMFYEAAIGVGGVDNGKPGLRPEYHERYYAAFVLDPDGNNIEAVFGNG